MDSLAAKMLSNPDSREPYTLGRIGGSLRGAGTYEEAFKSVASALADYYDARAMYCRESDFRPLQESEKYHKADAEFFRSLMLNGLKR